MIPGFSTSAYFRRCGAAFASTLVLAAGAAAQETPRQDAPAWIGSSIGVAKPQPAYLGRFPVVAPGGRQAEALLAPGAAARSAAPGEELAESPAAGRATRRRDTISLVAVSAETGEAHRFEAPRADFERLHLEMVMRGKASASEQQPAAPRASAPAGEAGGLSALAEESWSDGVPNFLRRGIDDGFPANHDIFRRIGQIGSGCSGVLIGPRHVLTAAHCVVDNIKMEIFSSTFRPRRDWTEGTAQPTAPFGARSFTTYIFPQEYWNGECDTTTQGLDCNKYDIALGILSSNMALPHMGYWYAPVGTLNSWAKPLRGYPRCFEVVEGEQVDDPEAPADCLRFTLYGDRSACSIGALSSPDGDGWNRELWVDCDGARGMSGSAMYTSDSPGGLVALGVYSQFVCTAGACATHGQGEFPNTITRITPEYAQLISMGKALWDCPSGSCL